MPVYAGPRDWDAIDTVFLDMDGTLLDLHFDNHFWLEHLPRRLAETRGIELEDARQDLCDRYRAKRGTLDWYCIDHWTETLGLDIALLKAEVEHLIAVHPHVPEFLEALAARGKRRVLVTNAHPRSLALKMERTRLAGHFECVISSHDLHLAKESPLFWDAVQGVEPFDRQRTLFVDDNLEVLRTAAVYGFCWLLAVRQPDSRKPPADVDEFPAILSFAPVIDELTGGPARGAGPQVSTANG